MGRRRRPRPAIVPTPEQIETAARITNDGHWRAVEANWVCRICGRTKSEIVQPSKQFPWSFVLHHGTLVNHASGETYRCCKDCGNVRRNLAKEAGVSLDAVEPDDIRAVILAVPHTSHTIREHAIDSVVARIMGRAAADPQKALPSHGAPLQAGLPIQE